MTSGAPLEIRLLGAPQILRDGVPVPAPRGRKAWAVLAYLALADRARAPAPGSPSSPSPAPTTRSAPCAGRSPSCAAPWGCRRRSPATRSRSTLPDGAVVDVHALTAADARPRAGARRAARGHRAGRRPGLRGVAARGAPPARRRLPRRVLHDAAHAALAAGRPLDGAALASRALALDALRRERARAAGPLPRRGRATRPPPRARRRVRGPLPPRARPRARPARRAAPRTTDAGRRAAGRRRPRRGRRAARGRPRRARRGRGGARRRLPAPGRAPRRARSATPRCWRARSPRSAWRSCTPSAAATRRAPRCSTRRSRSPRSTTSATSPRRCAASSATSRSRRPGRLRRPLADAGLAGWCAWTRSAPPCSPSAAWRSPTARTTRPRSGCSSRRSPSRAAAATSAARPGRSRSSAARHVIRGELEEAAGGARGLARAGARDGLDRVPALPGGAARRGRAAPRRHARTPSRLLDHAWPLGCRLGDPCWEAVAARALGAGPRRRRRARRPRSPGCGTPRCAPCGSPTRTSGSTRTASTRSPASRSRPARPRRPPPSPCSSGSPPGPTCASSSCAPRCTARALGDGGGRGLRAAARRGDREPRAARRSSPSRPDPRTRGVTRRAGALLVRRRDAGAPPTPGATVTLHHRRRIPSSRRATARCGPPATTRAWSRRSSPRSARASSRPAGSLPALRVLDVAAGTGNAVDPRRRRAAPRSSRATSPPSCSRPAAAARPPPGVELEWVGGRRRAPAVRRRVVRRRHLVDRRDVRAPPPGRRGRAGPRLPPRRHARPAELDARGHARRPLPHHAAVHAGAAAGRAARAALGQRGPPARPLRRPRRASAPRAASCSRSPRSRRRAATPSTSRPSYGPTIAARKNAEKEGRAEEFDEALDRFCDEWNRGDGRGARASRRSTCSASAPGLTAPQAPRPARGATGCPACGTRWRGGPRPSSG